MLTATKKSTYIGIGYSKQSLSFDAGVELARKVLGNSQLEDHSLFMLFATPMHKVDELMYGVRSVLSSNLDIIGCTTTGLVTSDFISYNGDLAGGLLISSKSPFYKLLFEENIKDREFEAGKSLAKNLQGLSISDNSSLIIFYDSIKVTSVEGTPSLNVATPILDGFKEGYKYWPTVAGVGTWSDINITMPCCVWSNDKIKRHGLIAVAIENPLRMDTVILHGTRPIGQYHTITAATENIIYGIDGRPALDVIDGLLGGSVPWEEFPLLITLGVNNGEKFGEYKEEDYASRLCFGINQDEKALIMFENDLKVGMEFQLMQRSINFHYIKPQIEKLLDKARNRKPLAAFYIDCLGRVSGFSGIPDEESLEVSKALQDIPFFGLFSGVEIANVGPNVKALDWTGVVCLFSEP